MEIIDNKIIEQNKNTLMKINPIITFNIMNKLWKYKRMKYGTQYNMIDTINTIHNGLSYTNILCYLSQFLKKKTYIEIGVSVGKNFSQICDFIKNSDIFAYDICPINPILERYINNNNNLTNSKLKKYKYNNNSIYYYEGDVFLKKDFNEIKKIKNKFNIIFSDACHSPEGIDSEYNKFIKDVLDDEFILYYDDLDNHEMLNKFFEIANDIKTYKKINDNNIMVFNVNGWVGLPQKNGIISSLDLKKFDFFNKL
tara:strand:- start:18514 stop:19275 length:762 start_codon:yes stop_codon:yes gene_type:complete